MKAQSCTLALPSTPLFGREQELAELRRLLSPDGARLLTLTGVGGAGKSRLAQAIALELAPRLGDAAWFVDLAPVRDPQLVPAAIAQALGVQESGSMTVPQILIELLGQESRLIVLDNFEQVLDAATFVAELLAACRSLVMIVTSREALGIRLEQVFQVEPLPVPNIENLADAQTTRVPSDQDRAGRPRRPVRPAIGRRACERRFPGEFRWS